MLKTLSTNSFLLESKNKLILDVRSPSEYHHAHIPNAINLPLFSDDERKVVGTAYKQVSRETAIKIGLDLFGLKMRKMVEVVEEYLDQNKSKEVFVHCWRGGMRSGAVAWLLNLYGFDVSLLDGGYKAYRSWVLSSFTKPYHLVVLCGNTGAAKTRVLQQLLSLGETIIDLEAIACHKGSAFGHIGQETQPRQEMFENLLAHQLLENKEKKIWIEDESLRIGHVNIPPPFWESMKKAPSYYLDIPFEVRLAYTVSEYGNLPKAEMVEAITRIQKRLGGLETKRAIDFLLSDDLTSCFRILLSYYDKYYLKAFQKKQEEGGFYHSVHTNTIEPIHNAKLLLNQKYNP